MEAILQFGAMGLLLAVLAVVAKVGQVFVARTLEGFDKLESAHREETDRVLDALDKLAGRIETGRCVYRPSAQLSAQRERASYREEPPTPLVPRGRLPSRPGER